MEGNATLWEVVTAKGTAQIHTITLKVGPNPSSPPEARSGELKTVFPHDGSPVDLHVGRTYTISVWGKGSSPSTATFRF